MGNLVLGLLAGLACAAQTAEPAGGTLPGGVSGLAAFIICMPIPRRSRAIAVVGSGTGR